MQPFTPIGRALSVALTADRLSPAQQVLGIMSAVAFFDAPLGHILLFRGGDPFRFYIKGRHQVAAAPGALDVNLAAAGHAILRTTRPGPNFPNNFHPDVLAYTTADGVTWTSATVNSVNFSTGLVNIQVPAGAVQAAVYFTTADGEFELRVVRPLGSDTASAKLFGDALRSIHEVDQTNARSAASFGQPGRDYPMPPQFRLELAVRSKTPVVFDKYAKHELSLPVFDTPVRVLDQAALNAQAELTLRGGTL